ncbi:hypothetical protein DL767_010454 [Monosporascus sp. MG133]|nr:hypothetical protein DL767_010454 [Monosporascus sp. MG133]
MNEARVRLQLEDRVTVTIVTHVHERGEVTQSVELTSPTTFTIHYCLSLCVSLNRASFAQITEGGPIPLPDSKNQLTLEDNGTIFSVKNCPLGARLDGQLLINGEVQKLNLKDEIVEGSPLQSQVSGEATVGEDEPLRFKTRYRIRPSVDLVPFPDLAPPLIEPIQWIGYDETTYIIRKNLEYNIGCLTVPLDDGTVGLMTDHIALPLAWARDSYWQTKSLMDTAAILPRLVKESKALLAKVDDVVSGHLKWLFIRAERPNGLFARSYLMTGKAKDTAIFQLDQQGYPFLLLCRYAEFGRTRPAGTETLRTIREILDSGAPNQIMDSLLAKFDEATGLFPTDETPADDKVKFPYHLSSQILIYHTMIQFADFLSKFGPDERILRTRAESLRTRAENLRSTVMKNFVEEKDGRAMFAYECNGHGKSRLYLDANDVPMLFGREWGFFTTEEHYQVLDNTMKFGHSPDNAGYCSGGNIKGLGSQHSPGTWTLGLWQELDYAIQTRDCKAVGNVWEKLLAARNPDWTFPETVNPKTGAFMCRSCFAWPGSMISSTMIKLMVEGDTEMLDVIYSAGEKQGRPCANL